MRDFVVRPSGQVQPVEIVIGEVQRLTRNRIGQRAHVPHLVIGERQILIGGHARFLGKNCLQASTLLGPGEIREPAGMHTSSRFFSLIGLPLLYLQYDAPVNLTVF